MYYKKVQFVTMLYFHTKACSKLVGTTLEEPNKYQFTLTVFVSKDTYCLEAETLLVGYLLLFERREIERLLEFSPFIF